MIQVYWALFQLCIGVCLKPIEACAAKNKLENCRHVGGVAVQPHVHCFGGLLQHSLYHYTSSNDGEPR